MKKTVLTVLCLLLMIGGVTAISTSSTEETKSCTEEQISNFKQCFFANGGWCDINNDSKWNLVDITLFTQTCYEEPIEEEVVVVVEVKKKSRSVHVAKEKDGSYTFRTNGNAVGYPNNHMIVRRTDGWEGFSCWNYQEQNYCGSFFKAYGYNYANIKVV